MVKKFKKPDKPNPIFTMNGLAGSVNGDKEESIADQWLETLKLSPLDPESDKLPEVRPGDPQGMGTREE